MDQDNRRIWCCGYSSTALATSFENLTEDYYTYKIEVTDNDGATASDLLNIIRIKDYILSPK
jgi:hypothetical protein